MSDRSDRLLTYEELAAALGRSAEAVRQLAKRKRWRRVISNDDGKARVVVPVEVLEAPRPPDDPRPSDRMTPERPPADRSDTGAEPTGDARALLDMLHAHVAELRNEAREARLTVADLTHRLGAAEGEVSAMRAILEIERERAKELREERDRWHAAATRSRRWWPFRQSA